MIIVNVDFSPIWYNICKGLFKIEGKMMKLEVLTKLKLMWIKIEFIMAYSVFSRLWVINAYLVKPGNELWKM